MGLLTRGLAAVLCVLVASYPCPTWAGIARVEAAPPEQEQSPAVEPIAAEPVSENLEVFRAQLLDFLHGVSDVLALALENPVIGPQLATHLERSSTQIPLPEDAYRIIELASVEQLTQLQQAFTLTPGILATPDVLRAGLEQVAPVPIEGDRSANACSDIYSDFNQIVALTEANRGLTIATNVLVLLRAVLATARDIVNAILAICESPIDIPLSSAQVPLIVVAGIVDLLALALATAVDGIGFQITDLWRCINLANCPPQGFSERFRPDIAPDLMGKGCDNRDNNCSGGIDEQAEDIFSPSVAIDAALASRCYADEGEARAAALLAVHASDDCVGLSESPAEHEGTLAIQFSRSNCLGSVMASATDKRGNTSAAGTFFQLDDVAPTIVLQDLSGTCQPSIDAARRALGFVASDACGAPRTSGRVIEKECVADFEFEAADACGNRTTAMQSVRVDDSPPEVMVETLLLPTFEGRFCFGGEGAAIGTVAESTRVGDNCSSRSELTFTTTAQPFGPNACDRRIVSAATDLCALRSEDAVTVRLDGEAPRVSCSVQQPILWPAAGGLIDVGFQYMLQDNCGEQDVTLETIVTSDEPTSFDIAVMGAEDPVPDAVVQYDANGRPTSIRLRAERQQTTSSDGRVYRIRLVATDACGNRGQGDCYVVVPKVLSGSNNSQLVNSGQKFDATVAN